MPVSKITKIVLSEEEGDWLLEVMQKAIEKMKTSPDYDQECAALEHAITLLETHVKVAPTIERKKNGCDN